MKKPKNKTTVGRRTKYTAITTKKICASIAQGLPNKYAAALAGISEETFYKWQRENSQFSESIQRAAAEGIAARLKIICRAALTDYRAACWWLEHVHPEKFAKSRLEVHHEGTVESKVSIG